MQMQHAARLRQRRMHPAMDVPGRRIGRVGPLHDAAVAGIELEQVARLDAGEMPPARIHQEALAVW
jgi:hypothetical protein